MTKELSNVRKKSKGTANVRKELSHVMLELHNVRIELSNMRKKIRESPNVTKKMLHVKLKLHNCEDETIKYEKKVTWYNRLPTSGYHTPFLGGRITLLDILYCSF